MYFITKGSVNGYQAFFLIRVEVDEDKNYDKAYSKACSFAAEIFSDMSGIVDEVCVIGPADVAALCRIINIKCYFDFEE